MPEVALIGVHDATAVGPVLTGVQVVVVQLFDEVATDAVHEATATLLVFTGVQLVVV